jgi:hypothetical protein
MRCGFISLFDVPYGSGPRQLEQNITLFSTTGFEEIVIQITIWIRRWVRPSLRWCHLELERLRLACLAAQS